MDHECGFRRRRVRARRISAVDCNRQVDALWFQFFIFLAPGEWRPTFGLGRWLRIREKPGECIGLVRVAACGWVDGSILDIVLKAGTQHFVAQRVTAVALIFLSLWFIGSISGLASFEYELVVEFIAGRTNGVLLALLCATLAYHSYLGIDVVIEDYVHAKGINGASLLVSKLAHILIAIASIYAIFSIGAGA